jgi:hypothetical protein
VSASIPLADHKKFCIELMDEILADIFGIHFLEPISTEKTIIKVIPQIVSRRKHSLII